LAVAHAAIKTASAPAWGVDSAVSQKLQVKRTDILSSPPTNAPPTRDMNNRKCFQMRSSPLQVALTYNKAIPREKDTLQLNAGKCYRV